eukprot:Anaeramoba_flamelloidesc26458_g1_i2.p1 GENE.c26458_g1_i2~~c26458_g1_i2.p1  ORF type:complete len:217 (-),score=24.10 c26458_g1_i2:61-711(-)
MNEHKSYVYCSVFNNKENIIASSSYDETAILWDLRTERSIRTITGHTAPISYLDFSHDDTLITTCSLNGLCRIWDSRTIKCYKTLGNPASNKPCTSVQFTPNSVYLVLGNLGSRIRLWDCYNGNCMRSYEGHLNEKLLVIFDSLYMGEKQNYLVSGSEDSKVYIWDFDSKEIVQTLEGHESPVISVSCNSKTGLIASGSISPENIITIWSPNEEND